MGDMASKSVLCQWRKTETYRGREAGQVGYYVELVKLALGVRDIYDVEEAHCVPFAQVSKRSSGSGRAYEESREPIARVAEACRRLKAAVERAVS